MALRALGGLLSVQPAFANGAVHDGGSYEDAIIILDNPHEGLVYVMTLPWTLVTRPKDLPGLHRRRWHRALFLSRQ